MYHCYVESEEQIKARWARMKKRAEQASKQSGEKPGGDQPPAKA